MLLMIACAAGIAYSLVVAAVWALTPGRARGAARPLRWSLRVFTAPLCAGVVLALLTLDTSTPRTTAVTAAPWQRASATVVRLVATDSGWGVHAIRYRVDKGPWRTGARVRITNQGEHRILYRSVGRNGRTEPAQVVCVGLDDTPPTTVTHIRPWMSGPVTIKLAASDGAGSGVASTEYRLDGGPWTTGDAVRVAGQGAHTLLYRSIDRLGNVEHVNTRTFSIDSKPPVTEALNAVTIPRGKHAPIRFVVVDLAPRAHVTIDVKGPHGETACDAGMQPTNRVDTVMMVSELPCGAYRYEVLATDPASNRSRFNGSNTLLVSNRVLALYAWASRTAAGRGWWATAFCRVTDEHGRPIRGAKVSFAWHSPSDAGDVATMVTGIGGGAYSSRSLARALVPDPLTIRVIAVWRGQKKSAVVRIVSR